MTQIILHKITFYETVSIHSVLNHLIKLKVGTFLSVRLLKKWYQPLLFIHSRLLKFVKVRHKMVSCFQHLLTIKKEMNYLWNEYL